MLEIYPSTEKMKNDGLTDAIFHRACQVGVPFILQVGGEDAGIMEINLPPQPCRIKAVGILPKFRGLGYGNFFTRAVLSRLCELSEEIFIGYPSEYYLTFGFQRRGDEMVIESKKLTFPHECCGKKE